MIIAIIVIAAVITLSALYLFAVGGSHRNDAMREFFRFDYAHRGLHGNGVPENSMAAFRAAAEKGYGAELDVHLTTDGNLAVVHDDTLLRTAGIDRRVCEMTADELRAVTLETTKETVPMLDDVLPLFVDTPLIIELKAERGNHAALCEAVCNLLDTHEGAYVIESFDPRCLLWLKKHRPAVLRGQLSQNFFQSGGVSFPLKFLLTSLLFNALTRPDFVAYNMAHRRDLPFTIYRRLHRGAVAYWTVRGDDITLAKQSGAMVIFEEYKE